MKSTKKENATLPIASLDERISIISKNFEVIKSVIVNDPKGKAALNEILNALNNVTDEITKNK